MQRACKRIADRMTWSHCAMALTRSFCFALFRAHQCSILITDHRYTKVSLTLDDNPDSNIVHYDSVQLGGHGLPCVTGRESSSELRILRDVAQT